jgi:drug/metabolite transporter (DMT)-like permease
MKPSRSAAKGGDGAITPWVLACLALNVVGGVAVSMLTIRVGRQVDVQSLIFLRMMIGVTMACVMMRLLRIRWVRDPHGRLARRSLFSALSAQATYISIASLPLATSTGIMHTHPVWTAVLGWFFLGVAVRAPTVAAIALCLIGALLTSWPPAAGSEFGMCCGFLGAFFSSCSLVATRSTQGFSAWQTIAHSSCCSGALALGVMLVRGEFGTTVRTLAQDGSLLLLIVIASVIGCLAQLAFVVAGQRVDAVVGSTFRLLEIPLALLVSGIVIEATEPSGFERYLGAGSILLGSAWLTLYSVPLSGKRLARRVASKRPWLEPTIDALR